MGRPKLPEFTAEDADTMGHLKAKMADLMKEYEQLKKKAIKSKIDCKEGSMFNVTISKSERTTSIKLVTSCFFTFGTDNFKYFFNKYVRNCCFDGAYLST